MRWFNSLPFNNAFSKKWDWIFNHNMTSELFDNGTDKVFNDGKGVALKPWKIMRGDMVVHFAGANPVRDSWMGGWLQRAEAYLPEWSNATKQVEFKEEALRFWEGVGKKISREREVAAQHKAVAEKAAAGKGSKKGNTGKKMAKSTATLTVVDTGHVPTGGIDIPPKLLTDSGYYR